MFKWELLRSVFPRCHLQGGSTWLGTCLVEAVDGGKSLNLQLSCRQLTLSAPCYHGAVITIPQHTDVTQHSTSTNLHCVSGQFILICNSSASKHTILRLKFNQSEQRKEGCARVLKWRIYTWFRSKARLHYNIIHKPLDMHEPQRKKAVAVYNNPASNWFRTRFSNYVSIIRPTISNKSLFNCKHSSCKQISVIHTV